MKITVETTVCAPIDAVWRAHTTPEQQQSGWQAILNNFKRHAELHAPNQA